MLPIRDRLLNNSALPGGGIPVYDDHIRKVVLRHDLSVARADDFFSSDSIMGEIWGAINSAKVIIADCTGRNPNVFYEVGIAHAIGKPVIVTSQTIQDVPFDLRHLRFIPYEYNPRGMKEFEKKLSETLKTQLHRARPVERIIKVLDEGKGEGDQSKS